MPRKRTKPYSIDQGITQSLLSSYVHCRQMAKFYTEGLRLIRSKQSLNVGSMVHQMLEDFYREEPFATTETKKAYHQWIEQTASRCGLEDTMSEDAQRAMAVVSAIVQPYIKYHGEHDAELFEWVELEKVFDINWNGYRLRGRRDGIVKLGDENWLFETKTTSQISDENYRRKLSFDFQVLFYITVAEAELQIPITGVIYNVIKKPMNRQSKKEGFSSFTRRMQEAVQKDPAKYFLRYESQYTRKQKREFRKELQNKLKDFDAWVSGKIPTYRNEQACVGKWACQYLAECARDRDGMYETVTTLFEELEG